MGDRDGTFHQIIKRERGLRRALSARGVPLRALLLSSLGIARRC